MIDAIKNNSENLLARVIQYVDDCEMRSNEVC